MVLERDAAWARLHDPATDVAELARIAAGYPEFADAVARHPNAYPELIAWARQAVAPAVGGEAAEVGATTAVGSVAVGGAATAGTAGTVTPGTSAAEAVAGPAASGARVPRWAIVSAIAVGAVLVLGGAGWAAVALLPTSGSGSTDAGQSDAAQPAPGRTLAGDPVYVGDELEWFLPDATEVSTLSPGASGLATDASYLTEGESAGADADKEECLRWIITDDNGIVGTRRSSWTVGADAETVATWTALQFPTLAQADAYYRSFADELAGCDQFQMLSGSTVYRTISLDLAAGATDDDVFVVTQSDDDGTSVRAFASEGNVVVVVSVPDGSVTGDPDAYATVLRDTITQARAQLTEEIGYR